MSWSDGFIAVDWGTTNRRAYRIDAAGACTGEHEDDRGVLTLRGEFEPAVAQLREALGDGPMLMAGMIGSNRGWIEAPYVPCPAGIDDLVAKLRWLDDGRVAIVPGLSFEGGGRADVMRGEEVQLLGAVAEAMVPPDATVGHPGTHNKWARIEAGRIIRFRTVMTGELFHLLRSGSVLSDILSEAVDVGEAFADGVREGLSGTVLTAGLFSVRARVLLGAGAREAAASYASGLLIGADVRVGLEESGDGEIFVMGRPELTRLYAAAIAEAGRPAREVDGADAFLAGARKIAERLA